MHLFTNFSVFWLSWSLMFIKWLSNVLEYIKKTILYLIWEKKFLLSWGSNPWKWDKTWRNMWEWKPGRNRIVELQIFDFSNFNVIYERSLKWWANCSDFVWLDILHKFGMVARGKNEVDVPLFWSLEVHGELTILKNNMVCDFMHYITLHFWKTNGPDKSNIFILLN